MTDQRDPIDDWLGSDVELMHPRPGTFQRVSRRARRRKTVQAIGTAAGAAVVIAAAATGPQWASLLPGGNGAAGVAVSSSPKTPATPSSHQTAPSPLKSVRPTIGPALRAGTGLSDTSNPAPPAFRPTSVTFVGTTAGTIVGAAIGQSGPPCPKISCTTVAGTPDYGGKWFGASALATGPSNGSQGVSQIRFHDPLNGWAYGPQLFATHDGGLTWRPIRSLPAGRRVVDLSTVGTRAFAVVASCTGTGPDYASGCTGFQVFSALAASDTWQKVPGASATPPVSRGSLQLTGQGGYLIAHGALLAGPVNGGGWHTVRISSPTIPPCLQGTLHRGWQPGAGLLAPLAGKLYVVCASVPGSTAPAPPGSLILYASANGGQTWQARGKIPARGTTPETATSLAVAPGGTIVLATSASIYYSADASTWRRAQLLGTASGGFSYVGMTTTKLGVAVPTDSALHELFITSDGGLTWVPSVIH